MTEVVVTRCPRTVGIFDLAEVFMHNMIVCVQDNKFFIIPKAATFEVVVVRPLTISLTLNGSV